MGAGRFAAGQLNLKLSIFSSLLPFWALVNVGAEQSRAKHPENR